jgi:hypothetical protein
MNRSRFRVPGSGFKVRGSGSASYERKPGTGNQESGTWIVAVATAAILTISGSAPAQWLTDRTPGIPRTADGKANLSAPLPRTKEGKPDLSGLWRVDPGALTLNLVSDLKPSEILPWAQALTKQRSEEFSKDHPGYRCMPEIGPLYSLGRFKLLQLAGTLAMLPEDGPYRNILIDGRALPKDPNPTWIGYSVGRWDGDTLVVESAGFNDRTWLDALGHPHTEALHVTERFRRRDFGHMKIDITFEDPKTYTRPWTISADAQFTPDTELLEFVCNENERSLQHFVITDEDRRKSREVVSVPLTVLQSYVGLYEGTDPAGKKQTFEITLSGDQLMLALPGGGKLPMTAESETTFSAASTPVVFKRDAAGVVTSFVVSTVEGDRTAIRKR